MGEISDLLEIRHFNTSTGGSVKRDFLEAVAERLGLDGGPLTKDQLQDAIHQRLFGADSPHKSVGGTVTNDGLQAIIDGLKGIGLTNPETERIEAVLGQTRGLEEFGYSGLSDTRLQATVSAYQRRGQGTFRTALLGIYGGACAISGERLPEVLEAAHIRPYIGVESNDLRNGLILRADLHRLWDTDLLAVHEDTFELP